MKVNQQGEKPSIFSKFFGGYWEALSHNAETSFDQLTPVSPGAKLVHMRTPTESYEREQVYGTESAFWNKPYQNFIKPFLQLTGKGLGLDSIPDDLESKRGLEEYFDVLKYTKNTGLANQAREEGNWDLAKEYEAKKDETLFGINPYTMTFTSIYRALPARDRNYFEAFSKAETMEERAKILELVPENEKSLYMARWRRKYSEDIKAAQKAGLLSEDQIQEAEAQEQVMYEDMANEGMPKTKELWAEYVATREEGENYADWYRRTKLLSQYTLPGPDWVGWHPQVDLEDIKLKVVQTLGEDMHDYNLWQDRARSLANKPFINDEAIESILNPSNLSDAEKTSRIDNLLRNFGVRATINSSSTSVGRGTTQFNLSQRQDYSNQDE